MGKKTITGLMAGILAAGMVTPAMATEVPNLDALNKAAYQAVTTAQTTKTQESINEAREAVQALKEAKPDSEHILGMVSTYSEVLDGVQQPILSVAIKATLKAEESGTQADINAGFKALPVELLELDGTSAGNKDFWRNKYRTLSTILDKAQKNLQDVAFAAVKKAEADTTDESIEAAQKLVTEVAKSDKEAIKDWARIMQDRLDAIGTFKVAKVADITETTVRIEFAALKEEVANATIEVKDADGKVHAVKALDFLDKGDTSAEFTFTPALKEAPMGEWSVNGIKYDATAKVVIKTIKDATTSQTTLDKIFVGYGFTGYNSDDMALYQTMIVKVNAKIETLEDVQKLVIDAVNENKENATLVKGIVEAAKANNDIKFAQKLKEAKIKRVNEEWLSLYKKDIAELTAIAEFNEVVGKIDSINNNKSVEAANEVIDKSVNTKAIAEAKIVVETYFTTANESDKSKVELIGKLDVQARIVKVVEAKLPSTVKEAIVALDSKEFDTDKFVNENLGAEYVTIVETDFDGVVTLAKLETIIKAENAAATTLAVEDLAIAAKAIIIEAGKEISAAQIASLNTAFTNLEKVSAKETVKFEMKSLDKNAYAGYASSLKEIKDVAGVNSVVELANKAVISRHFIDATVDTIVAKLESSVTKFGVKNFNKANANVYKAELEGFKGSDTVEKIQLLVDTCNQIAIIGDKTSTTVEVHDALVEFARLQKNSEINNTVKVIRMDIAELIVEALNVEKPIKVATIAEVNSVYSAKKEAQVTMMAALNKGLAEALKADSTKDLAGFEAIQAALKAIENKEISNETAQNFYTNSKVTGENTTVKIYSNFTQVRVTLA